ncbi:MAG: MFS transporter [Chloroflexota bacterium]
MSHKTLVWPFSFYFIISAAAAIYRPYLVLYYQDLSLTGAQIGLLVGVAPLIAMVSLPLLTMLADRTNTHRFIMSLSLFILVLGLFFFPYLNTFTLLFILTILFSIFLSPLFPLANSAAMFMLAEKKELYGRIRMGGTIGFTIAATMAGALVENYGLKFAFWGAAIIYAIAFFINRRLVYTEGIKTNTAESGRIRDLLKNGRFLILFLVGFTGGLSFVSNSTYLFPYLKELGAGESTMGFALTIGTIAEIPVLFFAGRFIKRFKVYAVLIFSTVMIGLRFLLLGVAINPTFVVIVQLLHGFTHPLLNIAGVTYADEYAPEGLRATAQGLFNTAMGGIGAAVGGFVGSLLLEGVGAKGMFLVFCLFVLVVLVIVGLIKRTLPPEDAGAPLTDSI